MLLAGDIGGTKTLLGLFAATAGRPDAAASRSYRTLDFANLGALCQQFLRDTSTNASDIEAACFGVAGPIAGSRAQLTNVPWIIDLDTLRHDLPVRQTSLINDLEALAWSIPLLIPDEIEVLYEGRPDPEG